MPKLDEIVKNGASLGIAIGLGAVVLAAAVVPVLPGIVRASRPTARAALKSGLILLEKGREIMAETGEEFEDILAEVKAELQQERNVPQTKASEIDAVLNPRADV
ncbi:MAG: DUF5132 domain-containing protein [Methylomonas sp.]|nr:DUF5132 domain-containing protein [Methylomonas sp.]PPD21913.1 MAG: DUF5132 domain-containing protein [Methylomonas sp.]PPD25110.1 MAG: DUF5132 domain-containing protein [Methylomonas sp.]PPD34605.1 MAG: DUF5132 domain-containing protein [Methylomonas sp.]PPD40611.1 MAG: DUF5132 domain-containing protein [Methylomonas sp.]